jgi:small subunit ribosomal protein S10
LAKLNIPFSLIYLPKKKKKITLLTSPHVFKKAREQFQNTSYSFILSFSKKEFTNLFPIFKLNTPKTIKISIKFLS